MKPHNALLTQARKERGWSQKDVAEKIGTLPNTVSRWERGEALPTPYYQQKLCDLFAKTPQKLGLLQNEEEERRDQQTETFRQSDQEPVRTPRRDQFSLSLQNRARMLERLRHSYGDLMSQSLQGAAWLELGIASKPDVVQNVANLLLRVKSRTEKLLPPGTSIVEAYDEVKHELLILGEPGAGKSTLLLLWRSRTFPLLVPQFLDDATARFLLRRVGGGYQFAHRLLLDHLADAPTPRIEQQQLVRKEHDL